MTTSFEDFVKELEARATTEERRLLDNARLAAMGLLTSVKIMIERREAVAAFAKRLSDELGDDITQLDIIENRGPFDHDGDCIHARFTSGLLVTILPLKGEAWGERADGQRVTKEPVIKHTDDELMTYIKEIS
jgi:pyruvate-formate lyase